MASKTVANDNRGAEIGDPLTLEERQLLATYRSFSNVKKALMRQRFAQIVPLPGERTR
jgi:hypothetical protein